MSTITDLSELVLRAHHVCCLRYWSTTFSDRGPEFIATEDNVKEVTKNGTDVLITVGEGPDMLCKTCPLCVEDRCVSPNGDEEKVRKWDMILMKEMEVPFGTKMTAGEWRTLVEGKAPFKICQKCKWTGVCSAGAK